MVSPTRKALTTSPPIDDGRQRLKNMPSKNRHTKNRLGKSKPSGLARAAQRTPATTWTANPTISPVTHHRQSA